MSTLRTFRNTSDSFGEPGPFEAASKEALADEMAETIREWATAKVQRIEMDSPEDLWDTESMNGSTWVEHFESEIRGEFIAALEEIED